MSETLFDPDFWKAQWGVIWSAPWVFLPALLIAFAVGWKWKGTNQDAEIRGLRADRDASVSRLDLVKENALNEAKELADLRRTFSRSKLNCRQAHSPLLSPPRRNEKQLLSPLPTTPLERLRQLNTGPSELSGQVSERLLTPKWRMRRQRLKNLSTRRTHRPLSFAMDRRANPWRL
jgi:hypothetical protein